MGVDFLLNVIAIPAEREPDWDAAVRRIDALRLEDLDHFFRYWDHDGGSREEAAADAEYVPKLKTRLRDELDNVRRSFGHYSRQSTTFEFRGFRFLATGGESVGSVPTELYDSISLLHAVGALEAAGFAPVDVDETDDAPASRAGPGQTGG
jgi:hypothetical protein